MLDVEVITSVLTPVFQELLYFLLALILFIPWFVNVLQFVTIPTNAQSPYYVFDS